MLNKSFELEHISLKTKMGNAVKLGFIFQKIAVN